MRNPSRKNLRDMEENHFLLQWLALENDGKNSVFSLTCQCLVSVENNKYIDNPLYNDTRYNDKTRYNDNLTVTKASLKR